MKKWLFLFAILLFPNVCFAMNVHFSTSFDENVDTEKINAIILLTTDANDNEIEVDLEKKNHYASTLTNIPEGNFVVDSLAVEEDYIGTYLLDYNSRYENNDLYIDVLVKNTQKKQNTTLPTITDEEWARIYGNEGKGSTTTSTTSTTQSIQNTKEITTEEAKVEEKKEEIKTRKKIYVIIFSILGLCLLIVLLHAFRKIINANK